MSDPRGPKILTSGLHCDHRSFFKMGLIAQEKCRLIAQAECDSDYFNFYELYYCYVTMPTPTLLVNLVLACLLWRFIYILVNKYILPAASIATTGLGLPETLAAFVIALAGRADSVMTAVVAGKSKEGLPLMIGFLYGTAMFAFGMNVPV